MGVFPVHFVDNDDPGELVFLEHVPDFFRPNLDAGDGIDKNGRSIHGPQASPRIPEKVGVSRRVHDVDLAPPCSIWQRAELIEILRSIPRIRSR
jgi:hypothetical protein